MTASPLDLGVVFSLPALWAAAHRASRGKRLDPGPARFRLDLEAHLIGLRRAILSGTWSPSPTRLLRLRDPKPRVIAVPTFGDRIVHHALVAAVAPRVERRLIADTYACRAGLGTHAALARARAWSRTWRRWVRLDVVSYFATVDHAVVRQHLARDVPHPDLRALCEHILDAGGTVRGPYLPGDDLFGPSNRRVGLPLGSLTSQLWANRYLDPVDHLVKDRLGLRGYLRYMGDMLLFHDDAHALIELARRVEGACHELRLRLHLWSVQPTRGGVGFVGFRLLPDHVRVRRSSVNRAVRRLRRRVAQGANRLPESLRAVFAHWRHADTWRLRERTLRELGLYAWDDDEGADGV